ncbi:aminodeoxychorismate/anthranilate synthase component II [Pseudidiomarina terrestris]|uniref:anthranilate synthase n=1 Tax=Pseudidiomarina terrestris TaxID=2820060 RepID=A0AAW7QXD6_9GAMM|nr:MULTISPECIES: aminodeoxychorismate/anthranilate synthase component II [unclassified Pseudidiomarina]MDN7123495.1 aminodeoxychorismate/anthranilate synthase component II [Pseudidiomarina sp. 1APP75-32.1]MDN7126715.1 aminodeoxychorismate/anthranilate synthase component II [Pseudidiomarina sp. 1APR75-33.1]MDN7128780.1 aminodeoxychorismate/anthranilate synthase component II [Pseudidiomarina sp. 1APR75-15]MDN7134952.1 aminodeoxychorismate/anthranilate synthase component II [Pseudidiomarina sp. 1A
MTPARIILIDNIDSFSYNLVDELRQLGYPLLVYRNTVALSTLKETLENYAGPQVICLSPGPGHPQRAGNLMQVIDYAKGRYPMLGICLGFQALLEANGAKVRRCGETVHGKSSAISCAEHPVFADLPRQLPVARYHSLAGYELPADIEVLADYQSDRERIPMAAYFNQHRAIGFQFHPESILTGRGTQLLAQTIEFLFRTEQQ